MDALYCSLPDLGVFEVTGSDARPFLNGQLSIDVPDAGRAPLAAWAAANGRVRALVRVVPVDSGCLLLAPASMRETLCRRLGMFVLRADVRIGASARLAVGAVLDAAPGWLAARGLEPAAKRDDAQTVGEEIWIRVGPRLTYVVGAEAELEALARLAEPGSRAAVELAEIELGLPAVVPETAEQFLPQMLDLDRLGGVAFDKGCYPGQEVIARTQNLGKVKRRPRRFALSGDPPEPGTAIYTADGEEAGRVLRAAREAERTELLAVVRLDLAASELRCGAPDGPPLTGLELARDAAA